ncbi:MAG: chromosome segregation protein ScpA [Chitinophagaceae bacterium]|nr:MAG: chromosome segregation protein ScpA [Chitinophagaceae bacterium]
MKSQQLIYEIKLPQYSGPFDLLLFFIERDELDIYDIPIAKITDDFLAYMNTHFPGGEAKSKEDIELASEFMLVAASLMRIKAKMLLPRKEKDEEGNEIDPREELVKKLLEYKRYKAVLDELRALEENQSKKLPRGNTMAEIEMLKDITDNSDPELHNLDLYKLLKSFKKVLDKMQQRNLKVEHKVIRFNYSIDDEKNRLKQRILQFDKLSFEQTFELVLDRVQAIFVFLAMLELIQLGFLNLRTSGKVNSFWLMKNEHYIDEE